MAEHLVIFLKGPVRMLSWVRKILRILDTRMQKRNKKNVEIILSTNRYMSIL
jgi:hypothetical protein